MTMIGSNDEALTPIGAVNASTVRWKHLSSNSSSNRHRYVETHIYNGLSYAKFAILVLCGLVVTFKFTFYNCIDIDTRETSIHSRAFIRLWQWVDSLSFSFFSYLRDVCVSTNNRNAMHSFHAEFDNRALLLFFQLCQYAYTSWVNRKKQCRVERLFWVKHSFWRIENQFVCSC